jgi:DNA-binding NarL/FixJ family response regulator
MSSQVTETVLIVEDHPMFVRALQDLMLLHYPHFKVVVAPTCASAQAWLVEQGVSLHLRAVFCDLNLADASGAQVVQRLKPLTNAPILVISADDDGAILAVIQSIGVGAFVSKRSSVDSLLEGMSKLLGMPQLEKKVIEWHSSLSSSQRKVAEQLINGLSNKEIAKALQLAPDTVKSHVSEIISRTGARNRTEAVLKLTNRT